MGTIGLSLEEGLTTTDPTEAYTKELVMEHAREVILLADSSKAHKISFTRAGRLEKVQMLITDRSGSTESSARKCASAELKSCCV